MMLNTSVTQTAALSIPTAAQPTLNLDSTLQELSLYDFQVDVTTPGIQVAQMFDSDPLLPGAVLCNRQQFVGIISRRRFLEYISRPFGRELFLKRPIQALYRFAQTESLIFSSNTCIVDAAKQSLQRAPELLYEPIIVEMPLQHYRLLDVHQLLVAQSHIHELATQLLKQKTQAQLIQTEKLASLGQMVAGVAHEIRNPVTCILGNLGFLSNYAQDINHLLSTYEAELAVPNEKINQIKSAMDFEFIQEDLPEMLKSMQVSGQRLHELVTSLHNFSHMDGNHRREANIHECIDSTLLILKNRIKKGIQLAKNYGDLPLVKCYSGQLSQVFINIISNAIDALEEVKTPTPSPPTIHIETEFIENLEESFTTEVMTNSSRELRGDINSLFLANQNREFSKSKAETKPQNTAWIAIRIADNGPGIPPEIQRRIFETFFTTKPVGKGTGLGLAISNQIITEKHGGQLNLHSTPGSGTEFEILLPVL